MVNDDTNEQQLCQIFLWFSCFCTCSGESQAEIKVSVGQYLSHGLSGGSSTFKCWKIKSCCPVVRNLYSWPSRHFIGQHTAYYWKWARERESPRWKPWCFHTLISEMTTYSPYCILLSANQSSDPMNTLSRGEGRL